MPVVLPRNAVRAALLPPRHAVRAAPLPRVLVVGCGALGRELAALTRDVPGVDVTCLPAELHNRPERIPAAVAGRIRARGGAYDRIFVAYADCGTGGALDRLLATEFDGVERIPGAHCYEFYAGSAAFAALSEEEPGTFYLTDFLARHFERLVWRGLGLDRHPELLATYFGNYRRLVYLAQTANPELVVRARAAADQLGIAFEVRQTGLGELVAAIEGATDRRAGMSVKSNAGQVPRPTDRGSSSRLPLVPASEARNGQRARRDRHGARLEPAAGRPLTLPPAPAAARGRRGRVSARPGTASTSATTPRHR